MRGITFGILAISLTLSFELTSQAYSPEECAVVRLEADSLAKDAKAGYDVCEFFKFQDNRYFTDPEDSSQSCQDIEGPTQDIIDARAICQ